MTVAQRHPILDPGHPLASEKFCIRCHKVIPMMPGIRNNAGDQLDNNLILCFIGGYGMFVDSFDRSMHDIQQLNLCHECAHDLCEFLGLDASHWHTHDPASGQHADHHDSQKNWSSLLR